MGEPLGHIPVAKLGASSGSSRPQSAERRPGAAMAAATLSVSGISRPPQTAAAYPQVSRSPSDSWGLASDPGLSLPQRPPVAHVPPSAPPNASPSASWGLPSTESKGVLGQSLLVPSGLPVSRPVPTPLASSGGAGIGDRPGSARLNAGSGTGVLGSPGNTFITQSALGSDFPAGLSRSPG